MFRRVTVVKNAQQVLQLTRVLRAGIRAWPSLSSQVPCSGSRRGTISVNPTHSHGRVLVECAVNGVRTHSKKPLGRRPHITVYNVKLAPQETTLCGGLLHYRDTYKHCNRHPSISMYIGSPCGYYLLKRKMYWRDNKHKLDPLTSQFLTTLFGPTVNKIVYNDAVDLACVFKHNFKIDVRNILDLSYMHITQNENKQTATSIAMLQELQYARVTEGRRPKPAVDYQSKSPHDVAINHLSQTRHLLRYLLSKQGNSENWWKLRIGTMIDNLILHPAKKFYAVREGHALDPGEFTASAFKGHLQATIDRVIGKPTTVVKMPENELFKAVVKSKSFVDRTALLTLNAFVVSTLQSTVKPLYAVVGPEAFHQLADLQVGDTVEITPTQRENGVVRLFNSYDRVCCNATRLHGDALMYNVRTGRLVPRITHPR